MKKFIARERVFDLSKKTFVMGILNVTPDSFSDGDLYFGDEQALNHAILMEKQGADIIDIGPQSTRPGHTQISFEEEISRLKTILPMVCKNVKCAVSVDTFHPQTAEFALECGVHIVNDVSGIINPDMAYVAKKYNAGWILMHNGDPGKNAVNTVRENLKSLAKQAESLGVSSQNICLDPGVGFGKDISQNKDLICSTSQIKLDDYAYLLGLSRKRVVGYITEEDDPTKRDFGSNVANLVGICGGANIIRVHDVELAVKSAKILDKLLGGGQIDG